jgi:coenzyme F420-dependent glucose-6-phosphate dehydrogenase
MNLKFGYRAAAEEHPADVLLRNSLVAESKGFDFLVTSDHFHPWFNTDAHSSFAFSWLASLGQATSKLTFGTGVTPPILRYHPALVAQAFGTLSYMYPGRVFLSVGTGEAMNEVPLGFPWPSFSERLERLKEAIEIIRALWTKDFVTYSGKYFTIKDANLYDKPKVVPPIFVAGVGAHSIRLAGDLGDGYMCVPLPPSTYPEVLAQLRSACTESGKDFEKFPKMVEVFVGYDADYDRALAHIRRWKTVLIPNVLSSDTYDPRKLEEESKTVDDSELTSYQATICTSVEEIVKAAERYINYGFDMIQIHSCSPSEEGFLTDFGSKGLPYLKQTYKNT